MLMMASLRIAPADVKSRVMFSCKNSKYVPYCTVRTISLFASHSNFGVFLRSVMLLDASCCLYATVCNNIMTLTEEENINNKGTTSPPHDEIAGADGSREEPAREDEEAQTGAKKRHHPSKHHRHHHRKSGPHTKDVVTGSLPHHHGQHHHHKGAVPRPRDVVIGAFHHPGTKECLKLVESIFDDASGTTFNTRICDAIWYELNKNGDHIKVLQPSEENPIDLTKEMRLASEKESAAFFRACYEMVAEDRASVAPPSPTDVWMSNEDHPGTEACYGIINMAAKHHFEGKDFSPAICEYINSQLRDRRFIDRPLFEDCLPWRTATDSEKEDFIRMAFIKAKTELDDVSSTSGSHDTATNREERTR